MRNNTVNVPGGMVDPALALYSTEKQVEAQEAKTNAQHTNTDRSRPDRPGAGRKKTPSAGVRPSYQARSVSNDSALATHSESLDKPSNANYEGYVLKLDDFIKNVRSIKNLFGNRYTENYDDVYHGDATDYAAGFRGARGGVKKHG